MKLLIKKIICRCLDKIGYFARKRKNLANKITILAYHRVLKDKDPSVEPGMYVTEKTFDMHMRFLKKHYHVISFEEFLSTFHSSTSSGQARNPLISQNEKPICVITFDDGWRDNYDVAFPILKKYELPATIFVTTDYIGSSAWFWPDRIKYYVAEGHGEDVAQVLHISDKGDVASRAINVLKKLDAAPLKDALARIDEAVAIDMPQERRMIDVQEMQEMQVKGISFGTHSCSHGLFNKLDAAAVVNELTTSKTALERLEIKPLAVLAYPNGNYNDKIIRLVGEAGYQAAVTMDRQLYDPTEQSQYTIPRIGMHDDVTNTEALFQARILGIF